MVMQNHPHIPPSPWIHRHAVLLVFLTGILVLTPSIWSETSITGQDEYWLSFRTPLESMERHTWLTPWVNLEPRLRKPPLFYWLVGLSYRVLGVTPFAARVWGVLFGAGLAALTARLFALLFRRSGLAAGLITLSSLGLAIEGRRAMLDLPVAFLTTLALTFAARWVKAPQRRLAVGCTLFLWAAFLIKGPMGPVFFASAALAALMAWRDKGLLVDRWPQIVGAALLFILLSALWPLLMFHLWPSFPEILAKEMAERQVGKADLGDLLATVGGALGLSFPWSLVLGAALGWALGPGRSNPKALWLALWWGALLLPSLLITSFARYLLAALPPASMLCAHFLESMTPVWRRRGLAMTAGLLGALGLLFTLFCVWFRLGGALAWLGLAACLVLPLVAFRQSSILLAATSMILVMTLLLGGLYPSLRINELPEGLESRIGNAPVAVFNTSQPSLLSMRLQRSVIPVRSYVEKDTKRLSVFRGMVFVEEKDRDLFERTARKLGLCATEAGRFSTFYSRGAWIRFTREDATLQDWKEALAARSLEALKPTLIYYRVRPCPGMLP